MENKNNDNYGHTDPDYIDQNTLVDGTNVQNNDSQNKEFQKDDQQEFGESNPDHIDQNTLVDNDNYARDEDPYQYQEEFIQDFEHPDSDFENKKERTKDPENLDEKKEEKNHDALINDAKEDEHPEDLI